MISETNNYYSEISRCCKRLKLSSNLAENAMIKTGCNNQEYLLNLFQEELHHRDMLRISKFQNTAGFPRRYEFCDFHPDEVQFPNDLTLDDLRELSFYREKKNLLMYGGTGTGKTMLSICIGIEACRNNIPVRFFRTAALVNRLSEAKSKGSLSPFLTKLDKASILILDEFGYVPYDRTGTQLLFDYLSEIHELKPVILNTNLEFSRWVNILYDEQMTSALIGRLMHHCYLILFPGENYRLKEATINKFQR